MNDEPCRNRLRAAHSFGPIVHRGPGGLTGTDVAIAFERRTHSDPAHCNPLILCSFRGRFCRPCRIRIRSINPNERTSRKPRRSKDIHRLHTPPRKMETVFSHAQRSREGAKTRRTPFLVPFASSRLRVTLRAAHLDTP